MQINIWLNLINKLTSRYEAKMSNICQVDLQPFTKSKILLQNMDLQIFSIIFPSLFLSYPRSAQPKDTPLTFLALTHTHALLIGFQEKFHQDPMHMHLFIGS
jgi:hypothetical protein